MRGLIVDNFAGGGGASTGIEMAIGRSVDIAINHDKDAIAMHTINHPGTLHYCESVFDVDPVKATAGRPVDLAWFSPDCKHFSKAKGGKPVSREIRGLAWVVMRWAMRVRPQVIMLENVEEFKTWGPVVECPITGTAQPCKDRKGETFNAFVAMLSTGVDVDHPALQECAEVLGLVDTAKLIRGLGYKVEWRELRACDYGAPTIRKRLFLVARCDGQPIVWPKPTHGAPDSAAVISGQLQPYRTAAECIDWSIPCPSIFERKRPLAENTLRRIAKGIQRFVIDAAQPFIVTNTTGHAPTSINGQLPTQTTGNHHYLCAAFLQKYYGMKNPDEVRGVELGDPVHTVTTENRFGLISANLVKHYGGNYTGPGASLSEPAHTVTTVDHHALVTSNLVKLRGTNIGHAVNEPVHTITAGGLHLGEVRAFLLKYYGNEKDGAQLNEPMHTVTGRDRFGLVMVRGEPYEIVDIGMRMLEPHELFAAQGFPSDYVISVDQNGKPIPKAKQVARCGNAVPPPFAEALVRANLPDLCAAKEGAAA
ncbi:DNA cytosine methyltransferase [Alishewanella sp. HL-SH06]|uniref:DNA cytosine methyltransferase n=1 Tax=Alishewanella sp. HL-SH06 TaxID=3461144 RepID=UPI0040420261